MNRKRLLEVILSILVVSLVILVLVVRSFGAIAFDLRKSFSENLPGSAPKEHPQNTQAAVTITEQPVTRIELAGPIADPSAQLSGLAWHGESLILLPQYPETFPESGDGFLFYLPKDEILAYLDGRSSDPLEPRPIQLTAPNLRETLPRYQGFESIGFAGDRVFLTIETGYRKNNMGYLIAGRIQPDLSTLALDTAKLAELPPQADSRNRGDEAMLVLEDKVITFYEVNGQVLNPDAVAHVFDFDLEPLGTLSMPNVEYRITDTALAGDDQFWAINYFSLGDIALFPNVDPIADAFGEGPTHAQNLQVERLLKFQYTDSGITLLDEAPVQLELNNELRNWEGLALLDDRGFLMATDKYPTTLLAFVPLPE